MATKLTTYDIVGAKEDVSDIISRISPEETPFIRSIGRDKVHNTLFQWQEDNLAAPDLNNAHVEGEVFADQDLGQTNMVNNYTQILHKVVNVAVTTDVVEKYGRAKELAYQLEKKGAEAKIDLESILLSGQAKSAGSSNTPRKMASAQALISPDNRFATGGASTAVTLDTVKQVTQTLRLEGAKATNMLIPVSQSDTPGKWISQSAGSYTRQIPNSGESSTGVTDFVDYVRTPTGRLDIELSQFILPTDALVYSPKAFKLATLRPWTTETLAKTADSTRVALVGEYSLIHTNSKASAVIRMTTGTNGKF